MAKDSIEKLFKGTFLTPPSKIQAKLEKVKAFVFDWDGVFNNAKKDRFGSSTFDEVGSMGTNLLRFSHYLQTGKMPLTAVITGETNEAAFKFVRREHFNSVYYAIKNKAAALEHFCKEHKLRPDEIVYSFDDVLDFAIAKSVGVRMMIGRDSNPMLTKYAAGNKLADYVTAHDGGNHGLREAIELLMGLNGTFDETIDNRVAFSKKYQDYFTKRNSGSTEFYTQGNAGIVSKKPIIQA